MKKLYTKNTIVAEQFTDYCIPDGVIIAPEEFRNLIDDFQLPPGEVIYIFRAESSDSTDCLIGNFLNAPYPFQWIEKGDYVVTDVDNYSFVLTEKAFERDFRHVEILPFSSGMKVKTLNDGI